MTCVRKGFSSVARSGSKVLGSVIQKVFPCRVLSATHRPPVTGEQHLSWVTHSSPGMMIGINENITEDQSLIVELHVAAVGRSTFK